jgi:glycosyltransferase involved in cell wall biosynthesis
MGRHGTSLRHPTAAASQRDSLGAAAVLRRMLSAVAGVIVDVGIPTRGEPRYLAQAIESVLGQTLTDWRLVISENGPGGGAVEEVVRPYLFDPRVTYSPTGSELSQAGNHTRVIQFGNAPYVVILHDDDWWGPTFLESRVGFLEQHPSCGMVFSGSCIVDAEGRPLGRSALPFRQGVLTSEKLVPALFQRNFIVVPSVLVRRIAYQAVGPVYSESVTWIDQEMWLRIASRFPVGLIAQWDSYYRLHERQLSAEYRLRLGQKHLELVEAVAHLPAVTPAAQRSARALALVHCALDDLELGNRRSAWSNLAAAVRADPVFVRNPHLLGGAALAALGIPLGPVGRNVVGWARRRRFARRGTSKWESFVARVRGYHSPRPAE